MYLCGTVPSLYFSKRIISGVTSQNIMITGFLNLIYLRFLAIVSYLKKLRKYQYQSIKPISLLHWYFISFTLEAWKANLAFGWISVQNVKSCDIGNLFDILSILLYQCHITIVEWTDTSVLLEHISFIPSEW